ncbi:hypothetical protein J8L70_07840 [Pseudoalteromonas sp. MMG010]|uniref:hypothetical protein n=1 Tax=Pseudoalteromonas sp. MMG010 TaxID=2822685 RepID=UPI001B39F436|nr:hypothetical protein [Pseudoalteromonas sp. MMG010]MBQ4833148.1 hypothetical protein [Pseudoalteromonas sp. MMG010]
MKVIAIFWLCLFSHLVIAQEQELPPVNPKYNAEHAMVLVNHGSKIFALNKPGYEIPHDVQVLYQIDNPDVAFLNLIRDTDLITIKPQPFNIEHLIRGEEITIIANVYSGDYNQGGHLIYENREIVMSKQLYARPLKDLSESSKWQEYDMITLNGSERIYIHKITQAPSFNHLIFVDLVNACMQKFRTSKAVPENNELNYKFINCGTLKPLYYNQGI